MNAPPPARARPPTGSIRPSPSSLLPCEPVLSACALMATLTSLHLSYSVARLTTASASPRALACARRLALVTGVAPV